MLDQTPLTGQPLARLEDPRFLTGAGAYTDDRVPEGTAWAVLVRSPEAHGRVRRLDTSDAAAMPGVLAVLTAADAAADGLGLFEPMVQFPLADGQPMRIPRRGVLAEDVVRHVGDPVAFVVAETLAQAKDAAEAVVLEIDPLPAVTSVEAIASGGAPPFDPDWPDHVAFHFEKGDGTATEAALAGAAHVTRLDLVISRVQPVPMEPRAVVGEYDAGTGRFTLTAQTQGPWRLKQTMAKQILKVDPERVRVISPDMGGGFGNRSSALPEHALVLWAARRLGRPVRWLCERTESFLADEQARESVVRAELGLDAEGRFVAVRAHVLYGMGAYHAQLSVGPATSNIGVLGGIYRIPAAHAVVDGVMLHVNPAAAYRGAGRPEACYILERLVDAAARETGRDPVALRRLNLIPPEAMPYATALGYTYDSGNFAAVIDRAMELSDAGGFAARRAASEAKGLLRGRGMACSIETAGHPARGEFAKLKLREDGGVTLTIGTHNHGQGHETAFRQVLADALGLGLGQIGFVQGDTDALAEGNGTGGSRCAALGGSVTKLAAVRLVEAAKAVAADALEAAPEDIAFEAGAFRIAGTDRAIGWERLAREAAARGMLDALTVDEAYSIAAPAYPNGCGVAEVEIDPETGAVRLDRYWVAGDYGTVLNPMLLEGQLHGGIAQGAGQILQEALRFDEATGQPLTASFMDYAMPRAADLPMMATTTLPVPTQSNVMGAKGVGEAGCVSSMPAVMNAVMDALAPLGVTRLDMPVTAPRVWAAIRAAQG